MSDETMVDALGQEMQDPPVDDAVTVPADEVAAPEPPSEEASDTQDADDAAAESPTVTIDGQEFAVSDLAPFVRFAQWAEANPQMWDHLLNVQSDPSVATRSPSPSAVTDTYTPPPDDLDPDDPYLRHIARLEARINAREQAEAQVQQTAFMQTMAEQVSDFADRHPELSDAERQEVLLHLRDLEVLPSFHRRYPARPDRATAEALETAYRSLYFDRAPSRQPPPPPNVSELRARRRAASASPVTGSTPRNDPQPESDAERLKMIADEIREAWQS